MTTALTAGVTRMDEAMDGKVWSIRGLSVQAKSQSDEAIIFTVICEPAQFVPVHVHADIDEVLIVQAGELQVKLDGMWSTMHPGDLMRIPRGVTHGFFNTSDRQAILLIVMSPGTAVRPMFEALDGLTDEQQVIAIAADHGTDILPLDANE